MKSLKFLPIFILFSFSNLYTQTNYKDNLSDDKSKYAGVYEGDLDIFLCCEMTETSMGTITFYFDGNVMKCIYDGLICSEASFVNNEFKCTATHYQFDIYGNFVKNKDGIEGLIYNFAESDEHPIGSTSFLKKIGDSETARILYLEAESELNEFIIFESEFRTAFTKKDEKKLLSMTNFPFYSKPPFNDFYETKEYWQKDLEIINKSEMKRLFKTMLTFKLHEDYYKYQYSDKNVRGIYRITSDKIFFYFKKTDSQFKLVYITGVYG